MRSHSQRVRAELETRRGHRVLLVERKGLAGSRTPVPLAPRMSEVLDAWLEVRPGVLAASVGDKYDGPIFVNERGRRLTRSSVWTRLRTLAKHYLPHKARTIHPHDCRHAFVTLSLDAGVPLRDVQDSAGHGSADTTRRYDRGRHALDRSATYTLSSYLSAGDWQPPAAARQGDDRDD